MDVAEYAEQKHAKVRLADDQRGMGWKVDDDNWHHFKQRVTVNMGNRQITIDWRQGEYHGVSLPEPADVLGSLISDGMAYESCQGLDDFMAEFGYEDRAKALKIYNTLKAYYPKIVNFFGGKEEWDWASENLDY